MKELSVTVIWEGQNDVSYRFNQFPVLVGRSPDCHLCILHETVPRELCLAWLENDGKTVRLEERSGLTNQLKRGKNIVDGGLSDKRIEVFIGPLKLRFEPGRETEKKEVKRIGRFKILPVALISVIVLASFVLLGLQRKGDERPGGPHLLPPSPFCAPLQNPCEDTSACNERARLFVTRARELLSRPQKRPSDRVRAAKMLNSAAQIYSRSGSPLSIAVREEATEVMMEVRVAYQNDSMILKRAHKSRKPTGEATLKAAARVIEYLDGCDGPWRPWLDGLVGFSKRRRSSKNGD